jgi:hypothetical protein
MRQSIRCAVLLLMTAVAGCGGDDAAPSVLTVDPIPETIVPQAGPEIPIAEGTYAGSDATWTLSAFESTDEAICLRLGGIGCIRRDIPEGDYLGARLTDVSQTRDAPPLWCVHGTVRDVAGVQIRFGDSVQPVPIFTSADFAVDFFVYCEAGERQPGPVEALDASGAVVDVIPDPDHPMSG